MIAQTNNPKISIVMAIFEPDMKVLEKVRAMLKKQTIMKEGWAGNVEIIENWNMPEIESMNTGIMKAKGEIIVVLCQDCLPINEMWLETLIKPMENPDVFASTSRMYPLKEHWDKYTPLTRAITINDLKIRPGYLDMRATAFRKKDLIDIGLFSEDQTVISVDAVLAQTISKNKAEGKAAQIVHPDTGIYHLHRIDNFGAAVKQIYRYSKGNGISIRRYGTKDRAFLKKIIRATPILGMFSSIYRFPYQYVYLFPIHLIFVPLINFINTVGFLEGYIKNRN